MDDKRLAKLVALQRARNEIKNVLDDMDRDCCVRVRTGSRPNDVHELYISEYIRKDLYDFLKAKLEAIEKEYIES